MRLILIDAETKEADLIAQVRDEDVLTGLSPEDLDVIPGEVEDSGILFNTVQL